jgi:hypothetical protein
MRMRSISKSRSENISRTVIFAAGILSATAIFSSAGCRGGNRVIPAAHAAADHSVEERAARALMGEDEDAEGVSPVPGQNAKKWRDTGLYVDGKPVGMLRFGELPVGLKPVWVEERHSAEILPGHKGLGYTIEHERRYRFADYLRAAGVDLARVNEIHVVGPKLTEVTVATGAELRSRLGRGFMFRFGGTVGGKAIPIVPMGFGNGVKPDKISAVMVYVEKKPPTIDPDDGFMLDGHPLVGVPYFGDPVRGGVRVYQDDQLKLVIKRPMLRETKPAQVVDGKSRYSLWSLLTAHGVDTNRIAEAWVIRDERRVRRLSREELETLTFESGEKEKNEILLGPDKERASALALHAHRLSSAELPQIRPEEQVD